MPKKLTPEQATLLGQLAAADMKLRTNKKTLRARLEAELTKQLEQDEIARNILAFQCGQADVPVVQIAKVGMHTTATISAYNAMAAGEPYAPKPLTEPAAAAKEFASDGAGSWTVTPSEAVLTPLLSLLGIDHSFEELDPELTSATFDVDVTEGTVTAVTEAWTEELGRHPVVALVQSDAGYRARVLEAAS